MCVVAEDVNMSVGSVKVSIHMSLVKFSQGSTRCVPKHLLSKQMKKCVKVCMQLLEISRRML